MVACVFYSCTTRSKRASTTSRKWSQWSVQSPSHITCTKPSHGAHDHRFAFHACISRINSEPVFKDQFEHVLLGSCSNLHRKCAAEMQVLTRRYRFMLIVLVFCVFRYLDPPNKNKKEREKLAMASPIKALTKKQVDLSGYVSQPEKALASYCNRHSCRGISRSVVLPVDCECDSLV